jgi:hypothetical protein
MKKSTSIIVACIGAGATITAAYISYLAHQQMKAVKAPEPIAAVSHVVESSNFVADFTFPLPGAKVDRVIHCQGTHNGVPPGHRLYVYVQGQAQDYFHHPVHDIGNGRWEGEITIGDTNSYGSMYMLGVVAVSESVDVKHKLRRKRPTILGEPEKLMAPGGTISIARKAQAEDSSSLAAR